MQKDNYDHLSWQSKLSSYNMFFVFLTGLDFWSVLFFSSN